MNLNFIKIEQPLWAGEIKETFDDVEEEAFQFKVGDGEQLSHEWWKLCDCENNTIGYGWVDTFQGDFEISLAVKREFRGNSEIRAGKLILSNLEDIAKQRNVQCICVVVKGTNPHKSSLIKWFYNQGYKRENESLEDSLRIVRDLPSENDIDLYKILNI